MIDGEDEKMIIGDETMMMRDETLMMMMMMMRDETCVADQVKQTLQLTAKLALTSYRCPC